MNLRKYITVAVVALAFVPSVFAAYTIARTDGGNNTLVVQGREYDYRITNTNNPIRLEDVNITLSTPNYDILVPPEVQKGPNKYSVDANGELVFTIRFHTSGTFSLTAANSQDPNNRGTLNAIQVQKYPVTFSVTPTNPTVNANQSFDISVTALDSNGVTVTAFEDPVQIVDSGLGDVTLIPGTSFANGQASNVPVAVKAGNIDLSNQFTLTLTMAGAQYYDPALPFPSLVARATKVTNLINLIPAAYSKLVMLFPGESLIPGVGKTGAPASQNSGTPVSIVTVRRVDSFFNPILTNPSSPVSVQFTSSQQSGPDTPPFPFTLSMSNALLSITSAMNQIYFGGAGDRIVKAIPDGDTSKEDSSLVRVNPGLAESYEVTIVGVAPNSTKTTDDVLTVNIQAKDQNGANLTTLFGQVPGAVLTTQFGGLSESRDWVDTAPGTLIPDNVVSFSGGLASLNVVITKFGSDARIRFSAPNTSTAESIPLNIVPGAANKIHFTIVGKHPTPTQGETWTPGTYPGNSGNPPTIKAGEEIVVEARITDARWNLVSGGGSAYTMQIVNNLPEHYLTARNINAASFPGPNYNFPNNGEFGYSSNPSFDKSFRVKFRTAGPSGLVSAPKIKTSSNLLGGTFFSSTMTVNPEVYSKMVLAVPGETLRPGIDTETDGKVGAPTARQAGVSFNITSYATDIFFNPIVNGPFPNVNLAIMPNLAGSFIAGGLPSQMLSGSKNFIATLQSGSNIQLLDVADPAKTQTVAVPVAFGNLHHFRMVLNDLQDKEAGTSFGVTITAEDQYDNAITNFGSNVALLSNTGATTMSPETILGASFTNGEFTGSLTMFTATAAARIQISQNLVVSQSPTFVVKTNSVMGYRRLVLLLPGEMLTPGMQLGTVGKSGTPPDVTVGVPFTARVISCDNYYNPMDATNLDSIQIPVELTSNKYATFSPATGNLRNESGHGEFLTTMSLRTAGSHTILARDVTNDGFISRSTTVINGLVGAYSKLQLLAPNEVADPGTLVPTGKTAAPATAQKAGVPFTVTIKAVDQFWNVRTSFSAGDIELSANPSIVLFNPPNNLPGNNGVRPFVNGVATREVILGQQGIFDLAAVDNQNSTLASGTIDDLQVNPGPVYVSTTPATVTAGQVFPVVLSLSEGGTPLNSFNGTAFLTANLASGGNGSGWFTSDNTPKAVNFTNGVASLDLTYSYAERIRIRITDSFGRVGFSNDIEVIPSGLKYRITVPTSSVVAGPPASFPIKVELLEANTETLVKNHDHDIRIAVRSAVNPTTDGAYLTTSAGFTNGVANFDQTYTKAESILIEVGESATNGDPTFTISSRTSTNVNVKAAGYKKLVIIAPGETHVPGVDSPTGKTGTLSNRQLGVGFSVQVRGVDQYWNIADDFIGGQINFTSNDIPSSLNAGNPGNQNSPLVNGASVANIALFTAGTVDVTVKDNSNPLVQQQTVHLTVAGNIYKFTSIPTEDFAGPPSQFTMNLALVDSISSNVVTSANHTVDLFPINPDGTAAAGSLGVTSAQLVAGQLSIPNQSYSIAENIIIRAIERTNNPIKVVGNSPVIQFIARKVTYSFEMPAEAVVSESFAVTIRALDFDTGTQVKNLTRSNQLAAFSAVTGQPATGVFVPSGAINIVNGVATLHAVYNKTEAIFLQMTDSVPTTAPSGPTQSIFSSPSTVNVKPGTMASLNIVDFDIQSNETTSFHLIPRDAAGNAIPLQTLVFEVTSIELPGQLLINGSANGLTQKADGSGEITVEFAPSANANGLVEMIVRDGDRVNGFAKVIRVNVKGFPNAPARARSPGEEFIPLNSTVFLDLPAVPLNADHVVTRYRVDNGAWTLYVSTAGIQVFNQLKKYQIEWYSEICYDSACSNPVSQFTAAGAANARFVVTRVLDGKLSGFPSPFNPKKGSGYMTITYDLPGNASVEIDIYDLFGQKVWHTDISAGQTGGTTGNNNVLWYGVNQDGVSVGSGGYVVVVKSGSQTQKTKILVVK